MEPDSKLPCIMSTRDISWYDIHLFAFYMYVSIFYFGLLNSNAVTDLGLHSLWTNCPQLSYHVPKENWGYANYSENGSLWLVIQFFSMCRTVNTFTNIIQSDVFSHVSLQFQKDREVNHAREIASKNQFMGPQQQQWWKNTWPISPLPVFAME